jgi:RNA polymerase sporulation-specific sigma factor
MKENPDTLLQQYKPLVKKKAAAYYLIGGDRDDLIQEGMIGLYKAIRDYDPKTGNPFHSFAILCINRQILTAVRASARQKHIPLNTSLSLSNPETENKAETHYAPSPETLVIGRENYMDIDLFLQKNLSALEYNVLHLYTEGRNHTETAGILNKNVKSIENALQRIRRKAAKLLSQ